MSKENARGMRDDTISRQAAIDAVKHAWAKGLEPTQYIEDLPSAQPDWNELTVICDNCGHAIHVKKENR